MLHSGHDFQGQGQWPWRYMSRSQVITCNTPSHTSDHLCYIWKESIENWRFFFKVKAEKFQKFAKNLNFQILTKMWHTTHPLMIVNPSRTVDATERTPFSRPSPNDLEDIGQGQRSLNATHPLILVIICAKYRKNPSRTVDFYTPRTTKLLRGILVSLRLPVRQSVHLSVRLSPCLVRSVTSTVLDGFFPY